MVSRMTTSLVDSPHISRAAYRREPYVHVSGDGMDLDAKAVAWTRKSVLVHWVDDELAAHNVWVDAQRVKRIKRCESAWGDPYDDFAFYLAQGQLELSASKVAPED